MDETILDHQDIITRTASWIWRNHYYIRKAIGTEEDAIQEALVYCWYYGRKYQGAMSDNAYFKQMARRGVWGAVQKAYDRYQNGHPDVLYRAAGYDQMMLQTRDFTEDVLNRMEIAQALGVLTPREKEIIQLRYGLDGSGVVRDYKEIARLLGVTTATVAWALNEAIKRIRTNFKVCYD